MSWDSYIENVIGNCKGSCDKVVIIALNGGGRYTSDTHPNALQISPQESQVIASALDRGDITGFQANGIIIGGEKYQFLRGETDEGFVLGKKKEKGDIAIYKANTLIIIAHTAEGKSSGDVNTGVGKVIDYFKGINF